MRKIISSVVLAATAVVGGASIASAHHNSHESAQYATPERCEVGVRIFEDGTWNGGGVFAIYANGATRTLQQDRWDQNMVWWGFPVMVGERECVVRFTNNP